jgi:hypothetical protein
MDDLSSSPILAKDVMDPEAVPLTPGKFDKDLALQFLSGQYSGWHVVFQGERRWRYIISFEPTGRAAR